MKTLKIIAIAIPVVISVGAVAMYIQYVGSTETLVKLHPHIDPTIVRKVSFEMFRDAMNGEYSNSTFTDDDYEAIFLAKVELHTHA